MSIFEDDRRHPASPTRRQQARQDGDSAKSHELAISIQILVAVSALFFGLPFLGRWLQSTTETVWANPATHFELEKTMEQTQWLTQSLAWALLPILGVVFLIGWVSHWLQTGFRFHPLQFSLPGSRGKTFFSNLFSMSALVHPFVTLPKVILAITVGGMLVWFRSESFLALGSLPTDELASGVFQLGIRICFEIAIVLLLASLADYAVQWMGFERRIRMTDQEVRDELRSQNGDPIIGQQRQQISRRMARGGSRASQSE